MRNLIIVGASGFGREVHQWLSDWIDSLGDHARGLYRIKGFLSDDLSRADSIEDLAPILGTPEGHEVGDDEEFVVAVGDISHEKARRRGYGFPWGEVL